MKDADIGRLPGRAIFALQLQGINNGISPDRLLEFWMESLAVFLSLDSWLSIQLRYIKSDSTPGPLRIALVFLQRGVDETDARARLETVYREIRTRLLFGSKYFSWESVQLPEKLQDILKPFAAEHVGELCCGEREGRREACEPPYIWHPIYFNREDMVGIMQTLSLFPGRMMFAATLRPVDLTQTERDRLALEPSGNGETPQHDKGMERHFLMRVHFAADQPLSEDFVRHLGRSLWGRTLGEITVGDPTAETSAKRSPDGLSWFLAKTPEHHGKALANLDDHAFLPWAPTSAPKPLVRMRYFVTVKQAGSILRPPLSSPPLDVFVSRFCSVPPALIHALPRQGAPLGTVNLNGRTWPVRQSAEDAMLHTYLVGKTGVGKSTAILNMALHYIAHGAGVAVIDPHGDLAVDLASRIPPHRLKDVIYFDPTDVDYPIGFNLLETDPRYPEQKTFVINELLSALDQLYNMSLVAGPMFESYFRNGLLAIMDSPETGANITLLSRFLSNAEFRKEKLEKCRDPMVRSFWKEQAEQASRDLSLANMTPYVASKLNAFIYNHFLQPIYSQEHSAFDLRQVMDDGRILIVRLNKGRLGKKNAHLLGMMLMARIFMAAMSRTDLPVAARRKFYCFIDEWHNFVTPRMTEYFAEARKYSLGLIAANQHLNQVSGELVQAVLGNAGTIQCFRVGPQDALMLAATMGEPQLAARLTTLDNYRSMLWMPVRGKSLPPFPVNTDLPPPADARHGETLAKVIRRSRAGYARPRQEVLEQIQRTFLTNEEKLARTRNRDGLEALFKNLSD